MEISAEVKKFCEEHKIVPHLESILQLIQECFSPSGSVGLEVENDPESNEQWIAIDFRAEGEPEDLLQKYEEYTEREIQTVPWPERSFFRLGI